jgi:hypothetical protein
VQVLYKKKKIGVAKVEYQIEYEEKITKNNKIIIKVNNEEDGNNIADELYDRAKEYNHPDCIFEDLDSMGVEIVDIYEGAETCEYEVQ